MNEVDREALDTFRSGCSVEAKVALGHLLRNAMQPAMLYTSMANEEQAKVLLKRSQHAIMKMADLVNLLTK